MYLYIIDISYVKVPYIIFLNMTSLGVIISLILRQNCTTFISYGNELDFKINVIKIFLFLYGSASSHQSMFNVRSWYDTINSMIKWLEGANG